MKILLMVKLRDIIKVLDTGRHINDKFEKISFHGFHFQRRLTDLILYVLINELWLKTRVSPTFNQYLSQQIKVICIKQCYCYCF